MEYQIISDLWGGNIDGAFQQINELAKENQVKGDIYAAFLAILHGNLKTVWNLITPLLEGEHGELTLIEHLMLQVVHSRALLREYKENQATQVIDKVLGQFETEQVPNDQVAKIWKASAYGVKASCALRNRNYAEGIKYMEKAIEIGEEANLPHVLTKMYNDMGNMYCESGDLEKGISSINKSIEIALTTEKPVLCCQYETLSELHLRKGNLDEALKYGEDALQVVEDRCNLWAIACYHEVLGGYIIKQKKTSGP